MFRPLWEGWPLTPEDREDTKRTKYARRYAFMWRDSSGTYFAITPCQRFVKVGRSGNVITRIDACSELRRVERMLGAGRIYPIRVYPEWELERRCHDFLAPDRITGEWYRVGPRVRILIAKLDREFEPYDLRNEFALARGLRSPLHNQDAA